MGSVSSDRVIAIRFTPDRERVVGRGLKKPDFRGTNGTHVPQSVAYYRADEPYLTVDKCTAWCRTLSLLLTAALDG